MTEMNNQPPAKPLVAIQRPKPPSAAMAQCAKCGTEFPVRIPMPRVVNAPDITMIGYAHDKPEVCPKCNALYIFGVECINEKSEIIYQWMNVERKSSITPGTDETLKNALATADLSKKVKQ